MVYDEFKRSNIQSSDESNSDEVVQSEDYQESYDSQKNPSSNQIDNAAVGLSEDDSLQWAKEAFAKLKQQQEDKNVLQTNFETNNNLSEEISSLNNSQIADNSKNLDSSLELINSSLSKSTQDSKSDINDFDDAFIWSTEVLAAQGRKADEISVEELDWLGRLRKGLEKSRQKFVTGLLEKLGDDPLTPEVVDDLETLLLRADAGVTATDQILDALRRRLNEEVVDAAEGLRFLKEKLCDLLDAPIKSTGNDLLVPEKGILNIWLLVGVNGVGKTTTLGKLANIARRSGYSALIAAADTFRAAAVDQVKIWGERSGIQVVSNSTTNADPAAVVFDAIGAAKAKINKHPQRKKKFIFH